MTQDEIIRMAREAGLIQYVQVEKTCVSNALERFAALVAENTNIEQQREIVRLKAIIEEQANGAQNLVLAEREACAKVCDDLHHWAASCCAKDIRARGEK